MSTAVMTRQHVPVLLREVVEALAVRPGGRYVDCTLGAGGHAEAILEAASPDGELLGIDLDPEALAAARQRLARFSAEGGSASGGGERVTFVEDNFSQVGDLCRERGFAPVQGILFDLGLSSLQLDEESRGFSFQREGPLDMRFSPRQELTAADIVNTYSQEDLADLLWRYGEERQSRRIARRLIEERPFRTTTQLAKAVEQAVGRRARGVIHPATRTFQALRIAVNQELLHLETALLQAHGLLGFGARLVVISYHSLEDRIVKDFLRRQARDCVCPPGVPVCICGHRATLRLVARGVVRPSAAEVAANPRARSARLRVAERLPSAAV
jgi:16S rRNA (cytosine1402-N4)-methyltransferase